MCVFQLQKFPQPALKLKSILKVAEIEKHGNIWVHENPSRQLPREFFFDVARIPCLKGFLEYRKDGLLEYRKVDEEIMQEYSEWLFKIFKQHSGIPAP